MELTLGVHSAWTFGWDALVAIGTLALAIGTAWAVEMPRRAEKRRRADESAARAHEARLFALMIVDELQRARYALAELRRRIRTMLENPMSGSWTELLKFVDGAQVPVLKQRIDMAKFLLDADANAVVLSFAWMMYLEAFVRPPGKTDEEMARGTAKRLPPLQIFACQAQIYVNQAFAAAYSVAGRVMPVPQDDDAVLTNDEKEILFRRRVG